MSKAYIFPGQGAQFQGMGKVFYTAPRITAIAEDVFEKAHEILGFDIKTIICEGSKEDLLQTRVTQPAIFLCSIILAKSEVGFSPDAVAGHSLGEFSALTAAGYIDFAAALKLVSSRASAMQSACEKESGGMAAILGLKDDKVEEICQQIEEVVVPANYNCIGQLVISGSVAGVTQAITLAKAAGAKRAIALPVSGAFHSPLMESAALSFTEAIAQTDFKPGICPIYQNVSAQPTTDIETIKKNLIKQLTAPVLWTQSIQNMFQNGITLFVECGPSKVLQGLVRKIEKNAKLGEVSLD